jgi:hypothetical protein
MEHIAAQSSTPPAYPCFLKCELCAHNDAAHGRLSSAPDGIGSSSRNTISTGLPSIESNAVALARRTRERPHRIRCYSRHIIAAAPLPKLRISKEEHMRSHLLTMTASVGLALVFLTTCPAHSITITTPAGVRQATNASDLTEVVHCRRYSHRHRNGHRWSRGCEVKAAITSSRRSGVGTRNITAPLRPLPSVGRSPGNFYNPKNPQDRSGNSNPQDMTQPRALNPQDMR